MRFDVSIVHETPCTRVVVMGEPTLGRLLSLVQVLEFFGFPTTTAELLRKVARIAY